MKLAVISSVVVICAATAIVAAQNQAPAATPSTETLTLRGCLKGDGSKENPWILADTQLPPPPSAAPAGGFGGRGGRGAGGRGGGRGEAGPGAGAPGAGGPGGAARGEGAPGAGGPGGAARGGPPAPPPPPPPQPKVSLRLSGVDFTPWRGMMVAVDGHLMPAGGAMREFHADAAHSAYGSCPQQ